MGKDLNIKSSTVEKGVELAKGFLDKLIIPAIEETGLLMRDKIAYWRFKNQVKILNKAKSYCEKHAITPNTVPFKLLVPLLETSALEEDEILQDKWATLIGNMVDSEQNIENHVFPYILGQISKTEYLFLEQVFFSKKKRVDDLLEKLSIYRSSFPEEERAINEEISHLKSDLENEGFSLEKRREMQNLQRKLSSLRWRERSILSGVSTPEKIPENQLKDFELSNLIRLGLVKTIQETYASPQTLEIPREAGQYADNSDDFYRVNRDRTYRVDIDIDIESNIEHIMTELGELFIKACTEKNNNYPAKVI